MLQKLTSYNKVAPLETYLQQLNYKVFCDKKDTFEFDTDFEQCTAFD